MLRTVFAGFLVFLGGPGAVAQTLDEAIALGLANNAGFAADEARLEGASEAVRLARAAGLPDVSISGSVATGTGSFSLDDATQSQLGEFLDGFGSEGGALDINPGANAVSSRAQLSVTQPVFTGLQISNGIKAARAQVDAAEADTEGARQTLIYSIAEAYLTLVTAEAEIGSVEKSLQSLTQAERAAEISFEAGQSTRTDTALASARVASVEARLAAARGDVDGARAQLRTLMGQEPAGVTLPTVVPTVPDTFDEALATARELSPALVAARARVVAADAALRQAKGRRSPTVQLRGTLSYAENQFIEGDRSENASIAAEVNVPLFQGGAISADVRQAAAEASAARYALLETERRVEADVRRAYVGYQSARVAQEAALAAEAASTLAFRGVSLERELGQRSVLDVLRVEEDLLAAEVEAITARRRLILAAYAVQRATGTLSGN